MDVVYTTVSAREEVAQILDLQSDNLATAISPQVALSEGFLTVRHDFDLLWQMNLEKPSIIAKNMDCVVGYALIMPASYSVAVPILKPMFDMLDSLSWRGMPIRENKRWFVMGQICVDKAFRGQGVFDGLYAKMKTVCAGDFDFTLTEVAERNSRSMRAHERAGFKTLHRYADDLTGETWRMILLEF